MMEKLNFSLITVVVSALFWVVFAIIELGKRLKTSNIDMWINNGEKGDSFSKEHYYSNMFGVNTVEELLAREGGKEILKNALEKAHDIRKFEIELFWKRANYYWVLIVFLFGAFSFTLNYFMSIPEGEVKLKLTGQFVITILTVIAYMGYLMSIFWTEVVNSSKIWYENWEKHINMLEYHITGNLHKIVPQTKNNIAVSSISKITLASSVLIAVAWLLLFLFSLWLLSSHEELMLTAIIIYIPLTIIVLITIKKFCRSTSANAQQNISTSDSGKIVGNKQG